MTKPEFLSELESLLELEPGTIKATDFLSDVAGWDSMAVLSFIAFADSKLGVVVAAGALAACRTVQDLMNLLPGKLE